MCSKKYNAPPTGRGPGRSDRERGLGEGLRGHLRLRSRRFAAMAKDLGRADFFLLESSSFARNEDVLVGGEAAFTNAWSPVPSLADHAPLSLPLSLSLSLSRARVSRCLCQNHGTTENFLTRWSAMLHLVELVCLDRSPDLVSVQSADGKPPPLLSRCILTSFSFALSLLHKVS